MTTSIRRGPRFAVAEIDPPGPTRDENEDQWMFKQCIGRMRRRMHLTNAVTIPSDLANLKRFTADIVCPDFDRTVMNRYIEYGNEDRWGKRKSEWEPVSFWAEDQLSALIQTTREDGSVRIGLDVSGPGGGQLTAGVTGRDPFSCPRADRRDNTCVAYFQR